MMRPSCRRLSPLLPALVLTLLSFSAFGDDDTAVFRQKALDAAAKGDQDGAIAGWSDVIRLNPDDAKAYYNRGLAKDTKNDLDGAIADYGEAIKLDLTYAYAYSNRGYAKARKGDLPGALLDDSAAIALDPQDGETFNNRGNARLVQGDLDGAIADFNETIRLNPNHMHAYNGRGNACFQKGWLDQAATDYTHALQLNPRYAHACNGRGLTEMAHGDYLQALADFTRAVTISPEYSHAYVNRGFTSWLMGKNEDALKDFQKTGELDPSDVESRWFTWLITSGKPERAAARSSLEEILPAPGTDPWDVQITRYLLGQVTQDDLLKAAAVPDEKTARQHLCEAYFYLGTTLELGGKKEEALAFFRRCAGTGQKDFTVYWLAQAKVRNSDPSTALDPNQQTPPAVWCTGPISVRNGSLLFTMDRPVKDNPAGNVVLLGFLREATELIKPLCNSAAKQNLVIRLYGRLVSVPAKAIDPSAPNVAFIIWKLHAPSDPDVLPPSQKEMIINSLPFNPEPSAPVKTIKTNP